MRMRSSMGQHNVLSSVIFCVRRNHANYGIPVVLRSFTGEVQVILYAGFLRVLRRVHTDGCQLSTTQLSNFFCLWLLDLCFFCRRWRFVIRMASTVLQMLWSYKDTIIHRRAIELNVQSCSRTTTMEVQQSRRTTSLARESTHHDSFVSTVFLLFSWI